MEKPCGFVLGEKDEVRKADRLPPVESLNATRKGIRTLIDLPKTG